jgi:hypothetical protein
MRSLRRALLGLLLVAALAPDASAANRLYAKYKQALVSWSDAGLSAAVDVKTDTIKVCLVTSGYTPATSTDQFLSAITTNTVGTAQTLTWASDTAGLYKASATSAFTYASGTGTYLVIYKDTGSAATSPLIAIFDTVTGLPATSNGAGYTLTVTWDTVAGLFTP